MLKYICKYKLQIQKLILNSAKFFLGVGLDIE